MRPYWLEQALAAESCAPCEPLSGDTRADVCIVGGGYTGLWTAIMLKQQNPELDVLLIEADICGAGASGRNGGCALSWSAKYFTLERLFGIEEAVRLVKESERSIHAIGAFLRTVRGGRRLPPRWHALHRYQSRPMRLDRRGDCGAGAQRHQFFHPAATGGCTAHGRFQQTPGGLVFPGCCECSAGQTGARPASGGLAAGG